MRANASFREAFTTAANSLRGSKLRSFLTLLGIILATTSLMSPFPPSGSQKNGPAMRLPDANANDITRLQALECGQRLRSKNDKIVDVGGATLKNNERDRTSTRVLLTRHVLINGDQHFKACLLGCGEEFAVAQALQTRVAAGLAVVAGEMVAQRLVDALVQEDAHLVAGEQGFFGFLESLQGHLPADGGEALPKALQAVPGFEIVEQGAHQNSRTPKRGLTGHDFGIANDDRLHPFSVPQFQTYVYRGHLGFLASRRPRFWADGEILDWIRNLRGACAVYY